MGRCVSFNLQIQENSEAMLNALSPASLYGRSVFTTIALDDAGAPFLWDKHLARLEAHAAKVGISISRAALSQASGEIFRVAGINGDRGGRARVTIFDTSERGGMWESESSTPSRMLIATGPRRRVASPLKLSFSDFPVNSLSPFAGLKTGNYLENLAAIDEAKRAGFDECIRLNERGEIVSASLANVFWTKGSNIHTTPRESGCLAGTLREYIMENVEVVETTALRADLEAADEIWLSSSGVGLAPAYLDTPGGFGMLERVVEELGLKKIW